MSTTDIDLRLKELNKTRHSRYDIFWLHHNQGTLSLYLGSKLLITGTPETIDKALKEIGV